MRKNAVVKKPNTVRYFVAAGVALLLLFTAFQLLQLSLWLLNIPSDIAMFLGMMLVFITSCGAYQAARMLNNFAKGPHK